MGLQTGLKEIFHFSYKETFDNHLTEHELDHVFIGMTDEKPVININEVMEWKYMSYKDLLTDINRQPEIYTIWFRKIVKRVNEYITAG
jgi:isopentenyl-diphosphate delta-isomerase